MCSTTWHIFLKPRVHRIAVAIIFGGSKAIVAPSHKSETDFPTSHLSTGTDSVAVTRRRHYNQQCAPWLSTWHNKRNTTLTSLCTDKMDELPPKIQPLPPHKRSQDSLFFAHPSRRLKHDTVSSTKVKTTGSIWLSSTTDWLLLNGAEPGLWKNTNVAHTLTDYTPDRSPPPKPCASSPNYCPAYMGWVWNTESYQKIHINGHFPPLKILPMNSIPYSRLLGGTTTNNLRGGGGGVE